MAATPRHRVFVYGTLKRGHYNHPTLATFGARMVGPGRSVEARPMVVHPQWGFPFVLDSPRFRGEGLRLAGEVWEVDDRGMEALDELEGVAVGLYRRAGVEVELEGGGGTVEAEWYVEGGSLEDKLAGLPMMDEYTKAVEDELYVPKNLRSAKGEA
mmetsp:Transcript_8771/g.30608  ORF Transcript_8771/g.30608 Transcript_8771/m.30608 type:complete len:156 (+) Transcript_8771:221-688(+)|eukprot:CAMPEP_0183819272 /NCGR_PEP_ID=MMETSP0803_2-20130417/63793_1 /TAXON_ID=195967 /ORGANISM="Crustomastix stigmata, Strain CCMP3273" /LENGTH=155 /DNA_ID=CAMNT_0026064159 /DNA_START=188 /DNA_END=655 /DNA_ORIENTATION=+